MDLTYIAASRILAAQSVEHAKSNEPGHIRAMPTTLHTDTGMVT